MLRITPVSAGAAGVEYLLGHSGCGGREQGLAKDGSAGSGTSPERAAEGGSEDYYLRAAEGGEAPGRWLGSGLEAIGVEAGGEVEPDVMRAVFGALVHPETGEALGRRPRRFKSPEERLKEALAAEPEATEDRQAEIEWAVKRSSRQANGYFDLTFSPAKSISVYWAALRAAGRFEDAETVLQAHRSAVAMAVAYLEREAGYSRTGYHGKAKDGRSVGEYVAARTWIATQWDHSTNREGEPQIHSHVAVLNRLRCEDGQWRTLDSKALYHERAGAAAIYELVIEEEIAEALPVQFETRPDGKAREIVGIGQEIRNRFSTRRKQVVEQLQAWIDDYRAQHGREPSAYAKTVMAERATLSTRKPKEAARTEAEQNVDWNAAIGEGIGLSLADVVGAAEQPLASAQPAGATEFDRAEVMRAAVVRVQEERAQWRRADLMLAIRTELQQRVGLSPEDAEPFLAGMADEAVSPVAGSGVLTLTQPDLIEVPDALKREADGRSRFRPHRDERYATEAQLVAEERLVAAGRRSGAPAVELQERAEMIEQLKRSGLAGAQLAAALGVLTSGQRADVLIGPAGTGKSYTVGVLTEQWEQRLGPVLGLATSQIAAGVLADEGLEALNITKFLGECTPDRRGFVRRRIEPGTLLVIDEAGMSATSQLDQIRVLAEAAGAKIVYTGDHHQLDAVGAGGALQLLAAELGAYELTDVRRMTAEWEQRASLRIREGDIDGLRAYDEHGRLYEGEADAMLDAAVQAYLADLIGDRQAVLVVPSNDQAAELSSRVRTELIRLGRVSDEHAVDLRDGTRAGVGDLIQTRKNDRDLVNVRSDRSIGPWVVNRDVWTVLGYTADGALRVQHAEGGHQVLLPADYVAEHVTLGYAGTVHASQGRSVDRAHVVVEPGMSREHFYVAMSRGRDGNRAYVVTQEAASDDNSFTRIDTDRIAVLSGVLEYSEAQQSAVQVLRDELEHAESLAALAPIWQIVVAEHARDRYTDLLLQHLGPGRTQEVLDDHGSDRLMRALRNAELAGHDPGEAIRRSVERDLSDARSIADVLRYRVRQEFGQAAEERALTSWVNRTPAGVGVIGDYTLQYAEAMDRRTIELGEQATNEPPAWAIEYLGAVPGDPLERQQWVQRAGTVAAWRELSVRETLPAALGPAPSYEMPEMRAAWDAAYAALGRPDSEYDVHSATEGKLQAMVRQYEREQEWAPLYAADLLREATQRADRWEQKSRIAEAEAEAAGDERAREIAASQAANWATIARAEADRAAKLAEIHAAREVWYEHTADSRQAARLAQIELTKRNPEPPVVVDEPEAADRTVVVDEPEAADRGVDLGIEVESEPRVTRISTSIDLDRAVAQARAATNRIQLRQAAAAQERELEESASRETASVQRETQQHRGDGHQDRGYGQGDDRGYDRGYDG